MHEQDPRVKLLTLLNVQSAKPSLTTKRDWHALAKKSNSATTSNAGDGEGAGRARKRLGGKLEKAAQLLDKAVGPDAASPGKDKGKGKKRKLEQTAEGEEKEKKEDDDSEDEQDGSAARRDPFTKHFLPSENPLLPISLSSEQLEAASASGSSYWKKARTKQWNKAIGEAQVFTPKDLSDEAVERGEGDLEGYRKELVEKMEKGCEKDGVSATASCAWLSLLSTYQDVLYPHLSLGDEHDSIRRASAVHSINHVLKTRSKILKTNDYLSRVASGLAQPQPNRETADQSFTRPKVLILAPLRSSALTWMQHLVSSLPSSITQVENYPRFVSEYSLPEGARDKVLEERGKYPSDHVEIWKGNVDDSFRVGVKVTRKSVKVFSNFYESDMLIASPLGLRTSIEKDGDSDFLSSIEYLVVDQMDVMTMQNWEHVQFVMSRLNKMPETDHGCDFSRVKGWYLDGKSAHLRQTLLLSTYLTPEISSLFSHSLLNRAGKLKALKTYEGGNTLSRVPEGLKQVWTRFEAVGVEGEEEKRWEWFVNKTLPLLLRSALSSSTGTLLIIPSYFDFLRLKRHLQTSTSLPSDFSFAAISEYSETSEVSRARGAFVQGRVRWLIVTERFHFYKRYRLRGAKTFVFYAPPQNALYYPEILSFPFCAPSSLPFSSSHLIHHSNLDQPADEEDATELTAHVLFSKWDFLRLERIVGSGDARRMCREEEGREGKRFTFL
ncbi:hypothetical protein JCM11641_001394 [Rhodosporidiobolus odoratus]